MKIPQLPNISDDAGKAFTAPMRELVYKYADVFTKPCKSIARDIKYKIELLDPEKTIPHHKLLRMNAKELQQVKKAPARILRERLDTA